MKASLSEKRIKATKIEGVGLGMTGLFNICFEKDVKEFIKKIKYEMQNTYCGRGIGLRTKIKFMKIIDEEAGEKLINENNR